ncbi:PREDICTED: putative MAGE domain-containing protein CXorf50 [Galeopterus variegatus]|uniref:MAGE domain-containing protein CXorf50 n=1 Tax=Galeopterus variegatus TaxID=482537 RepID=A0ABM0S1K2_GALVR|nr:PREDICTED: putative MAGE domain-containing protein CXorf50 [Galeopterus variegatus]
MVPIKRADMLKYVIKRCRSFLPEIFKKGSDLPELVFGFWLKELDPTEHSCVLIRKSHSAPIWGLTDDQGTPETGLLLIARDLIFMQASCASEEVVWEVLRVLEILFVAVNEALKEEEEIPCARDAAAVGDVTSARVSASSSCRAGPMPWLKQAFAPVPVQVPVPGREPWLEERSV